MQLRPTFCLWMETGDPAGLDALRERWRKEPFAGAAHVIVEQMESFLQTSDEEWHRRILQALTSTGAHAPGLAVCYVWNLAYARENFFDKCLDLLVQAHERLDHFLHLNSSMYPQLQNRLGQLVIRLPLQGQPGNTNFWLQKIQNIQNARMPLSRVVVVGNSNVDPQDHATGVTVKDEEVFTHLAETLLCLIESRTDRILSRYEQQVKLPFWSAGCARILMDLENASSYLACRQGAHLLREQLREDGEVLREDPPPQAVEFLELAPEVLLWRLLEGPDPHRTKHLERLRQLRLPDMDPEELEKEGGENLPAAYMTQGMIEISENLGVAYDHVREHRQWIAARSARRLFEWIRDDMDGQQSLYWVQLRHRLERIQDANQRARGAYPGCVEEVFAQGTGRSDSSARKFLDQVLPPDEEQKNEPTVPDPFARYRDLRARVRERKWAPSHLARWMLAFLPLALAAGIGTGSMWGLPLLLQALAGLAVMATGLAAGGYLLHREKSLRRQSLWAFRDSLRLFARLRLKKLLKDQGELFYGILHHVMGEPEETAARVALDPEKAFGRHAQNPEMQPVLAMDFHARLLALRSAMEETANRIDAKPWESRLTPSRWLHSFFDEENLREFPFLMPPREGNFVLDPAKSPDVRAQLSLCLRKNAHAPAPWCQLWEILDRNGYEEIWVRQVQMQGYSYFDKLSLPDFVEYLHARNPSLMKKESKFIRETAHPYYRLAITGSPHRLSLHALRPASEEMQQSGAVQSLVQDYTDEQMEWDGLPGILCMRVEGPLSGSSINPLPIAHTGPAPLSDASSPDEPVSFV